MFKFDRIVAALCTILASTTLIVAAVGPAQATIGADNTASVRTARIVA